MSSHDGIDLDTTVDRFCRVFTKLDRAVVLEAVTSLMRNGDIDEEQVVDLLLLKTTLAEDEPPANEGPAPAAQSLPTPDPPAFSLIHGVMSSVASLLSTVGPGSPVQNRRARRGRSPAAAATTTTTVPEEEVVAADPEVPPSVARSSSSSTSSSSSSSVLADDTDGVAELAEARDKISGYAFEPAHSTRNRTHIHPPSHTAWQERLRPWCTSLERRVQGRL